MSSLPYPSLPVLPFPSGRILLVRVTVRRANNGRHNTYVKIERTVAESDADTFAKAIREYRYLHGDTERIVAIDLYPNQ